MPKIITPAQRDIIVTALAAGDDVRTAGRKGGASKTVAQSLIPVAAGIKKRVADKVADDLVNGNAAMVAAMRQPIMDAIKAITPESIAKQSASANATAAAILIDKVQLLTGGVTDIVEVRDSQNLVDNLSKKLSAKYHGNNTITDSVRAETAKLRSKISEKEKK